MKCLPVFDSVQVHQRYCNKLIQRYFKIQIPRPSFTLVSVIMDRAVTNS